MKVHSAQDLQSTARRYDSALSPSMPVLNELDGRLGGLTSGVKGIVGLQHLFGSTATLVRTLAARRVMPEGVFLLGKPYSANSSVVDYLGNSCGYWVHPETREQAWDQPNDDLMDGRIVQLLDRVRSWLLQAGLTREQRVLLIDDGGRAIRLLHTEKYADIRSSFTCVEQTRCGIRTIEGLDLQVPVVNVAESWAKLELESPLIATSVTDQLVVQLKALARTGVRLGRRASVIGYGAIGQAVADKLQESGFDLAVFDRDSARRRAAAAAGYAVIDDLTQVLRRGGIIIGCTGLPVFGREMHSQVATGSLLISASSADVEYKAWQLRAVGQNLGNPKSWDSGAGATRDYHPCFSLYRIRKAQGSFYLVNGGFPVNFDGGIDTISPDKIQLTRSLLYLGALQASQMSTAGVQALRNDHQQLLARLYGARAQALAA